MEYLVNSREMKTCDTNTIEHFKVPSMVLMERAALSAIEVIQEKEISCNRWYGNCKIVILIPHSG